MTETATPTPWVTDSELAAEFGVSTAQLNAASQRGEFPKLLKIGRAVRYSRAAVDAWLAEQSGGQK